MTTQRQLLTAVIAVLAAALISFVLTPVVKALAPKFGFVDVPKDERRMHNHPIPTIGGLAIFVSFVLVSLFVCHLNRQFIGMLLGALVIVVLGVVDDKYDLNAKLKLAVQILAAAIPVSQGMVIRYISHPFGFLGVPYLSLGVLAVPVTICWIVAITNAVNFIDGLDGLSVGVCSISSLSMGIIALMLGQSNEAVILAALLGACLGFLPYNFNPAKIFMGDTGASFLGFMLSCMAVSGLFKLYAVISFVVPILVLGVPLFASFYYLLREFINSRLKKKGLPLATQDYVHVAGIDENGTISYMPPPSIEFHPLLRGSNSLRAKIAQWFQHPTPPHRKSKDDTDKPDD